MILAFVAIFMVACTAEGAEYPGEPPFACDGCCYTVDPGPDQERLAMIDALLGQVNTYLFQENFIGSRNTVPANLPPSVTIDENIVGLVWMLGATNIINRLGVVNQELFATTSIYSVWVTATFEDEIRTWGLTVNLT